ALSPLLLGAPGAGRGRAVGSRGVLLALARGEAGTALALPRVHRGVLSFAITCHVSLSSQTKKRPAGEDGPRVATSLERTMVRSWSWKSGSVCHLSGGWHF